jgi:hypothetical protein
MRLILAAILAMGVCGQAWAWDDEPKYPFGGMRRTDELEVEFGPPSVPMGAADRGQIDLYLSNKQNYDEAMGRLQLYNQRKIEKLAERQEEIVKRMEEESLWEDIPRR